MIRYFLLSATLSCILFTSCTKQESSGHQGYPQTPTYEKAPQIPIDTNLVEGVMLAERVSYNYSEGSNNGDTWVWFYDKDHSSYLRMDTLTFNGHEGDEVCYWPSGVPFPIYPPNLYHAMGGSCSSYHMDSSINWRAVNDSNNINIQYNYTGAFPHYSAKIPTTASATTGLTFLFDSSTITGADSVRVTIENHWGTNPLRLVSKTFSANAGNVVIDFNSIMSPNTDGLAVALTLFTYTIQTFNGKDYAFIKQDMISANVKPTQ